MVVKSNLQAVNSNRMLGITVGGLAKSTEKLSSGYRINRSADDAAGLAISEKMRRQIRGLTQAARNAQDGVSFCQIADGALEEVHDMLKRCQVLATQSANGTNSDTDRQYLQEEVSAICSEIDRVHETSVFNELRVFTDAGVIPDSNGNIPDTAVKNSISLKLQNGATVTLGFVSAENMAVSSVETAAIGAANSSELQNSGLAQFALKAAADAVSRLTSTYGTLFSKAGSSDTKLGLALGNIDGSGNTLAYVSMTTWSDGKTIDYTIKIDTSDYARTGPTTDKEKAELAATIAHEMTHLFMDDTLTAGMMSGKTTSFPNWFVEGAAQTSSGDNGWVVGTGTLSSGTKQLNTNSTDNDIKAYMSTLSSGTGIGQYGSGYLATMYLGYLVGGSMSSIGSGLNTLLSDIASGNGDSFKTLNQAIADNTRYSGLGDFETKFRNGDAGAVQFIKDLLSSRNATPENISNGTAGAGSVLVGLSTSELTAFSNPGGTSSAYQVQKDSTSYRNVYGADMWIPESGAIDGGSGGGGGNDRSGFYLQLGTEAGQGMYVKQFNASAEALFGFGNTLDVSTVESAGESIKIIKDANTRVSTIRAYYGATQNRLEHTIKNLNNVVENSTAAESQIRDTNMSEEMVRFSNLNILQQAGTSMLAQSNQRNQMVLSLLQ